MSLRYGLLGLLAEGPASGFDLARRFDEVLGTIWPAQHPKIYEELRRLDGDGLIELEGTGPRGRKSYAITDAGLAEIRQWLTTVEVDHTMRLQPVLRSLFFWLMDPDELRRHLQTEAEFYRSTADTYRRYAQAKDRGDFGNSLPTQSMRITVEAGIRINEALADWADWAQTAKLVDPERHQRD